MGLFWKKHKEKEHQHEWKAVKKVAFNQEYISKLLFSRPYEFAVPVVATLYKCVSCGEESAEVREAVQRTYISRQDIPPGIGPIEPAYFHLLFEEHSHARP